MNSVPRSDAPKLFESLRLLCRRSCGDASRLAIGELVAALRDEVSASGVSGDYEGIDEASLLWENVSRRITLSLESFDREVVARLAGDHSPRQPIGAEKRLQQLDDRLTSAIRSARPHAYARYARGVGLLSPNQARSESDNPLSARVISRAFIASVSDVLARRAVARAMSPALIEKLGNTLAAVYVTGESFLDVNIRFDPVDPIDPIEIADTSIAQIQTPESEEGVPIDDRHTDGRTRHSCESNDLSEPASDETLRTANQNNQPELTESTDDNVASRSLGVDAAESTASRERYAGYAWHADQTGRHLAVSPLAGVRQGANLAVLSSLQPVAGMERDAVAFAHAVGELPYSPESRRRYFAQVRESLAAGGTSPTQLALVDLVAAVFDFVVDNRRLADSARPLVWRLQQPALMLTLLDSAYIGDDKRSVRHLIEHFGAIASTFGSELIRGSELYHRLETVVRAFEVISSVLYLRANVLAMQVQKEYERCAASMTQLVDRIRRERLALESTPGRRNRRDYSRRPGRDEERLVTDQLATELSARLRQNDVPESVRTFLEGVWLRHMRTTRLRDGQDSQAYQTAAGVVDELIWTLNQSGEKKSRRELARRIPGLIDELTRGMRLIGAREEDHQAFFDELFLLHLHKLRRRLADGSAMPAASTVPTASAKSAMSAHQVRAGSPERPGMAEYDLGDDVPVLDDALSDVGESDVDIPTLDDTLSAELTTVPLAVPLTDESKQSEDESARASSRIDSLKDLASAGLTPLIELPVHNDTGVSTAIDTLSGELTDASTGAFTDATTAASIGVSTRATNSAMGASATDGFSSESSIGYASGYSTRVELTTQVALPTTDLIKPASASASNDDQPLDNQLVNSLSATGLNDLPLRPRYLKGGTDAVFDRIRPGTWLELHGPNKRVLWLKVAWLNRNRTMMLLVRHPDGRAMSRSGREIRGLIEKATLLVLQREQVARM
ncbi:MAG: DUF1631 family protein [Burkholderiaceae bacterium]